MKPLRRLLEGHVANLAQSHGVSVHPGFKSCQSRLFYEYSMHKTSPVLLTVLPDGSVEKKPKRLEPSPRKILFTYSYPQSLKAVVSGLQEPVKSSPFVRKQSDGSWAVVQAWTAHLTSNFEIDFQIQKLEDVMSSEILSLERKREIQMAQRQFSEALTDLFGEAISQVLYCTRTVWNEKFAFQGKLGDLTELLQEPAAQWLLGIKTVTKDYMDVYHIRLQRWDSWLMPSVQRFYFGDQTAEYVVYMREGNSRMTCIKTLEQFQRDCSGA
jgi:hypothetical protein